MIYLLVGWSIRGMYSWSLSAKDPLLAEVIVLGVWIFLYVSGVGRFV